MDGVLKPEVDLSKFAGQMTENLRRALIECSLVALRVSKSYAPRSPTMKQRSATLKRKKRTKQRSEPGGLEKSIATDIDMNELTATIFVARNSPAGVYAKRIHDEKNIKWFKRGAGTIAKGKKADEKFIARAIQDKKKGFERKFAQAISAAIDGKKL